jgi:hypothetical protein
MDRNIKEANKLVLENVKVSLVKNRFKAFVFETKEEMKNHILNMIGQSKKIGMGGSISVKELGLEEELSKNNIIYTHKPEMTWEERRKVWLNAIDSDFYLASPQAITFDGKLIFVDGNGNRCAALTWGPRHLVLIAGVNKIVRDFDQGLWRSRNIAAVRNNIRLNKKNPCVITGKCEDCLSEERICNILTVLYKKPKITEITVFLLNDNLGY